MNDTQIAQDDERAGSMKKVTVLTKGNKEGQAEKVGCRAEE
jgi:hypothetical protein